MISQLTKAAAAAAAVAVSAAVLTAAAPDAAAYPSAPPWVAGDTSRQGNVLIYNSSGAQITGGSNWTTLDGAAFFGATTTSARTGATAANMNVFFPDAGNAIPGNWLGAGSGLQASTPFSTAALTPAPIGVTGSASQLAISRTNGVGGSLWGPSPTPVSDAWSDNATPSSATNYQNVLEIRMVEAGAGLSANGKYWAVDIEFNPAAAGGSTFDGLAPQEWKVVYPVPTTTQSTVSTPVPSLPSPQAAGTSITLQSVASTAGSVQFTQNGSSIGSPITVNAGNSFTATSSSISLVASASDYTFAATFTPADVVNFSGATSGNLTYTVLGTATSVTTPTPSVASGVNAGTSITLSATVTPAVAGSIRFKDNNANIVNVAPVAVDGSGAATSVSFVPAPGSHSFTAVFSPTDFVAYQSSTSSALVYDVIATAPANLTKPAISGIVQVGRTVTCTPGTWTNSPTTLGYAWTRSGSTTVISRASRLVVSAAWARRALTCTVTATNAGGSASAASVARGVLPGVFKNTLRPKIVGTPRVGRVLKAYVGRWSPAATKYTYVWKRGSVVVGRGLLYRASARDRGKRLTLIVTAIRSGYTSKAAVSLSVIVR
jgi:hypothetical protein